MATFTNTAKNTASYTNTAKSSIATAEVDYTFQDTVAYTFQDVVAYVFKEATAGWTNQTKN